jgi:hypothetical protein
MQRMMKYEFKQIQSMVEEAITKQMEVWCCFLFQLSFHAVLYYFYAAGRGRWLSNWPLVEGGCVRRGEGSEVEGVNFRKGGGVRRWALLLLIFLSFSCLSW